MEPNFYFYIENFCNNQIKEYRKNKKDINHEEISSKFYSELIKTTNEDFCNILLCAGFIPDLYDPDSSEETLFTKLTEVLVAAWAVKMGFKSKFIKQKSSYEDIKIEIGKLGIACDAKSFRLGRSQKAPNVKDFLKLEDIRKWLNRYEKPLGGLVAYPDVHEWTSGSDAYQYCTTKETPTVMLPYKYLALLLHFKKSYSTCDLVKLWEYKTLFPQKITKKENNKKKYWDIIDKEILSICHISQKQLENFIKYADIEIESCIKADLDKLKQHQKHIISIIQEEINNISNTEAKNLLKSYRIEKETKNIRIICQRIQDFRLK